MSEGTQTAAKVSAATGPTGLSRWWIVPTAIIVIELLVTAFNLVGLWVIKSADAGSSVIPEGVDVHDPDWVRLIAYEWNTGILVVCALAALLVLLFTRSWLFPGMFIGFWALIVLLGFFHIMQVNSVATLQGHGSYVEIIRPVIYCVIWMPTFLKRDGLKSVFNRPWPMANPF